MSMHAQELLFIFIFWGILALIPGFIAKSRGRSFWGFWFLGMLFFFPGLFFALRVENKKDERMRKKNEYDGYKKLYKERQITKKQLTDKKNEIFGKGYDW